MIKPISFILFLLCTSIVWNYAQSPSHQIWDGLLKQHVKANGYVDYSGFRKDIEQLNSYLDILSDSPPKASWTRDEKMAYWINAYNAFTIKLVVEHYPVKSIKEIKRGIPFVNTVWDIKFIKLGGQDYDLNKIEHGILRKEFQDARVHAAVNCASYSCPPLRGEAFTADRLQEQLEDAMRSFVNDPMRNNITDERAELSAIFKWFSGDFKADADTVIDFINRYAEHSISASTKVSYLEYNWSLNDAVATPRSY